MTKNPQNSVVSTCIVTYNNEAKIGACVASILDNVKLKSFTLYVVDNGSTDHTCSLLKERFSEDSRFVLLETGENCGFGAGHNKVLPLIQSDYHCVINPDILLKDDVVEKMVTYMNAHPDVVQLSPRICFPDGKDQILGKRYPNLLYLIASHFRDKEDNHPNFLLRRYAMLNKGFNAPFAIKNATGCFMIFRTDAFQKLGGFDDRYFMYFEDCDITREMNHLGKVLYFPSAVVYHAWERSSKSDDKLLLVHIMSMLKYYVKWYTGPLKRILTKVLMHFDIRP
ncbi:MAG TPA: glycosyltransferase family 2 protein [Clostridiales bacterium]|nr:glycosyltransferase family 2 protein [Clostridiales bacterium]